MIVGIEAPMSAGKTLVMTYFLISEYCDLRKRLLTNYNLLRLPSERFDVSTVEAYLERKISLKGRAVGLDEAHLMLDSRLSMTRRNRIVSYFLTQTSKNDINLYYTTQDLGMVDVRLRRQTAIGVTVEQLNDTHFRVTGANRFTGKKVIDGVLDGSAVFPHFDTHEVIDVG